MLYLVAEDNEFLPIENKNIPFIIRIYERICFRIEFYHKVCFPFYNISKM